MTRKPGRPKKDANPDEAIASTKFQMKMTPADKKDLETRAKIKALTVASFVRLLIRRDKILSEYTDVKGGLTVIDPSDNSRVRVVL